MNAYKKRNYMAQGLSPAEATLLKPHDRMIAQLKAADRVVMPYPMHNFGIPGPVKTWFDAVMFSGETFEMGAQGPVPVMKGRKSLTLYTAGGIYPSEKSAVEYPFWDTLTTLAKIEFGFMGFDENEVNSTSLRDPSKVEEHLKDARAKMAAVLKRWRD